MFDRPDDFAPSFPSFPAPFPLPMPVGFFPFPLEEFRPFHCPNPPTSIGSSLSSREMGVPSDGGEEVVAPRVPPVPAKPGRTG